MSFYRLDLVYNKTRILLRRSHRFLLDFPYKIGIDLTETVRFILLSTNVQAQSLPGTPANLSAGRLREYTN